MKMNFSLIQNLSVVFSLIYLINCDDAAESTHGHRSKRIVGGTAAVDKQFPFMAFVSYYYDNPSLQIQRIKCTGVIIAAHWVVTAANCFEDFVNNEKKLGNETLIFTAQDTYAMAGILDAYGTSPIENFPGLQDRAVDKIYIHTAFTVASPMYDVDVALLKTLMFDLARGDAPPYFVSAAEFTTTFGKDDVMLSTSNFQGAMPCVVAGFGVDRPEKAFDHGGLPVDAGRTNTKHIDTSTGVHVLKFFPANAGGTEFCRHNRDWLFPHSREVVDEYIACARSSGSNGPYPCWGDNGAALVCGGKVVGIQSLRRELKWCDGGLSYSLFTMLGHPEVYYWMWRYVQADLPKLSSLPVMPKVDVWPH